MQALGDGRTLLIAEGAAGKDPGALAQLILDAPFGPHSVYVLLVPALLNGMLLESPEASLLGLNPPCIVLESPLHCQPCRILPLSFSIVGVCSRSPA